MSYRIESVASDYISEKAIQTIRKEGGGPRMQRLLLEGYLKAFGHICKGPRVEKLKRYPENYKFVLVYDREECFHERC